MRPSVLVILYLRMEKELKSDDLKSPQPKERKIIHVDMDCFFVSVEEKLDPSLKGKPVVVAGESSRRGVVSAANYEARKYGIHSAMATATAERLCKKLVIAPHHFSQYKVESQAIKEIFSRYTDKIEPLSLDEAFLDVSTNELHSGSATLLAKEIRDVIWEERQLRASAGIASNKFLAKVASDWKKPNGQFTVSPEIAFDFASALPVRKIFGVGEVTEKKMHKHGLHHCSDIQKLSIVELEKSFGSWGRRLYNLSRGIDNREVKSSRKRKSFSVERTFDRDLKYIDEIEAEFKKVFDNFIERFKKSKTNAREIQGVSFKLKYFDFKQKTKDHKTLSELPAYEEMSARLRDFWTSDTRPIRLIGFGVRLKDLKTGQLELEF